MEIQFLGTGAGQPTQSRNVSSIALKMLNEMNQVWLFDVGEGTQHQILRSDIRSRKVTKIFLSHLHGDHVFGLPGFLASRNFQASENAEDGKPTDLTIYAPIGVEQFIRSALFMGRAHLDYKINFVELSEGTIYEDKKIKVSAFKLNHNVPAFAFRIEEAESSELDGEKLLKLGVPNGPLMGKLKSGQTVTLPDGREVNGKDYLSNREGRIVTIVSDTKNTPNIVEAAENADVLVHEATYDSSQAKIAKAHNHSTALLAGEHARDANVKELILTHISPRYLGKQGAEELASDAKQVFENVIVARDLMEIIIPQKDANHG